MSETKKRATKEEKMKAVYQYCLDKKSVIEIANQYFVTPTTIYNWIRSFGAQVCLIEQNNLLENDSYEKVVEIGNRYPDDANIQSRSVIALIHLGKKSEALKIIEDPRFGDTENNQYFQEAKVIYFFNEYTTTNNPNYYEEIQKIAKRFPENPSIVLSAVTLLYYYYNNNSYMTAGERCRIALGMLKNCSNLDYNNVDVAILESKLLISLGKYHEAQEKEEQFLDNNPKSKKMLRIYLRTLNFEKKFERALEVASLYLKQNPNSRSINMYRLSILYDLQEYDKVKDEAQRLLKSLNLGMYEENVRGMLVKALIKLKDYESATSNIDEISNQVRKNYLMMQLLMAQEKKNEALELAATTVKTYSTKLKKNFIEYRRAFFWMLLSSSDYNYNRLADGMLNNNPTDGKLPIIWIKEAIRITPSEEDLRSRMSYLTKFSIKQILYNIPLFKDEVVKGNNAETAKKMINFLEKECKKCLEKSGTSIIGTAGERGKKPTESSDGITEIRNNPDGNVTSKNSNVGNRFQESNDIPKRDNKELNTIISIIYYCKVIDYNFIKTKLDEYKEKKIITDFQYYAVLLTIYRKYNLNENKNIKLLKRNAESDGLTKEEMQNISLLYAKYKNTRIVDFTLLMKLVNANIIDKESFDSYLNKEKASTEIEDNSTVPVNKDNSTASDSPVVIRQGIKKSSGKRKNGTDDLLSMTEDSFDGAKVSDMEEVSILEQKREEMKFALARTQMVKSRHYMMKLPGTQKSEVANSCNDDTTPLYYNDIIEEFLSVLKETRKQVYANPKAFDPIIRINYIDNTDTHITRIERAKEVLSGKVVRIGDKILTKEEALEIINKEIEIYENHLTKKQKKMLKGKEKSAKEFV